MNNFEQSGASVSEMLVPLKSALNRYIGLAIGPALVAITLALLVVLRIPSYYISDVLISIQPRKLTAKIIEAPTKEEQAERLQSLIFEVISRQRLMKILDDFNLYPEYRGAKGREQALQLLRGSIVIEPERSTTGQTLEQTFRLAFTSSDPNIAYGVTKAISNLFIDESILSTKGETEGTVEFLDAQLRSARQKLESTEQQVQNFVRQNFGKLPEHLQAGIARLESAQSQLATNSQLIAAKTQKLEFMQKELQLESKDSVPIVEGPSGNPMVGEGANTLGQMEEALAVLKSKYSDEHPDVIAVKKRIEMMRKAGAGAKAGSDRGPKVIGHKLNSEAKFVRREIGELEADLASLNQENANLKRSIDELEADIKEMPLKEQELVKINRDYANVKANYERLSSAREDAVLQRDLVTSQKGTQFRIVDAPARPEVPAGPPRALIGAGGIGAGVALLVVIPMVLMLVNGSFKTRDEVEADLGLPVIGVIPPMSTPRSKAQGRRALTVSLAASAMSFVAAGLLIVLMV